MAWIKCNRCKMVIWLDDGDFPISIESGKNANHKKKKKKILRETHWMWRASHVTVTANTNIKSNSIRKWPKTRKFGKYIVCPCVWVELNCFGHPKQYKRTLVSLASYAIDNGCNTINYNGGTFLFIFPIVRSVDCHFLTHDSPFFFFSFVDFTNGVFLAS